MPKTADSSLAALPEAAPAIDSSRSAQLVNDRVCYVAISRARLDARIYTDDQERMRRSVARTQEKELALDVVERSRSNRMRMSY